MRWPFLLTIRPGVDEHEVDRVVSALPAGTSTTIEMPLRTLVVRWSESADADAINKSHEVLSRSELFYAGPGDEEAVRRYLSPDPRPASWVCMREGPNTWLIVCNRCGWKARHQSESEADADCDRHDREAHDV